MSKLPISPLKKGTHDVEGTEVPIQSLSREDARTFVETEDGRASEVFILVKGVGVTDDEAGAWLDSVDYPTAAGLITAILKLSGLKAPEDPEKAKDPTPGSAETS